MNKAKLPFFARHRYEITPRSVVVYPDFYARAAANILMLVFGIITLLAVVFFNAINFALNGSESWQYALMTLPFLALPLLFRIILFPFYHTRIVFDAESEIVSRHTIFGKKILCRFVEIADVERFNAYFLRLTNDPYGLGIRISSGFRNAKEHKPFYGIVIPAIENMLLNARMPASETIHGTSFYKQTTQGFRLKRTLGFTLVWVPWLWVAGLLYVYVWQIVSHNNNVLPVLVMALASIAWGIYEQTTIKQFIANRKECTVYRYCFFKTFSKALPPVVTLYLAPVIARGRGAGLALTRRSGVEIFLKFPDGSKTSLRQFGNKKTYQIPAFLSETEAILLQMGVNRVERKIGVLVRTYKNIMI